ncbi:MAG: hypothetical protein FVQ82_04640 [Planctomycetes bacterium]|nr:hypothetical protein [Planctomycetota bacterium]
MKTQGNDLNTEKLLSASAVGKILDCGKRTVYRYSSCRRIPAPVRLSGSTKWKQSEINLFLECDCDMDQFNARKDTAK